MKKFIQNLTKTQKLVLGGLFSAILVLIAIMVVMIITQPTTSKVDKNKKANATVEEKTKEVKHTLTLNLKEVSVEEGAEYKITDFIDSILRDDVKLVITEKDGKYLVSEEVIASETTENDANESTDDAVEPKYLEDELVLTYESEDMAKLTEVGEHTIKVKATLGRATAEAEAKLNITAKPEEEPAQATTNTAVRSNSGSGNSGAQAAQPAQSCTRKGTGTEYNTLSKTYSVDELFYATNDSNYNAAYNKELSNVEGAEIWKATKRWREYGIRKSYGNMNLLYDSCDNAWGFNMIIDVYIYETLDDGTGNPYWYSFQHDGNTVARYYLTNNGNNVVWIYNPNNLSWN